MPEPSVPAPTPGPPQAGPQQMADYYGAAPKPPTEPTQPATPEQMDAYNAQMSTYQDAKASYEAANGPPPQPAPVVVPAAPGGGAGKPAARLGDQTAHGGVVVQGLPTVLIANKPAAAVTHMHTCPMVTGIVPHVGGPVIPPGSTTVLICNMPAARIGDQATCTGPPDVIAAGAPTVLIG